MRGSPPAGGSPILDGMGTLAGVLASADRPVASGAPRPSRFAEALGQRGEREAPLYAPIRFTALLNTRSGEERLRALRRAVLRLRAAKRPFDIGRFAADLLHWSERTRLEWTFQYHQRAFAAPAANNKDEIA